MTLVQTPTKPASPAAGQFTPSAYQQAIFDAVQRGTDGPDLFVSAVAGSGKTTTIVKAAQFIDTPGMFAAFNVSIVDELNRRLAHTRMNAINFHKIGKRALDQHLGARTRVDKRKYSTLARSWANQHAKDLDRDQRRQLVASLTDLLGYVRKTLTDPADRSAVIDVAVHYDIINLTEDALAALPELIQQGQEQARRQHTIDFDDMLYLPVAWKLALRTFDWVFVDEAQDLSPVQLELVLRCRKPGGRMVFVGDERQAIYGFAGADNRSVERIIERVKAQRMPLSICYRCPTSHLELAREIVPNIEARPNAPDGEVHHIAQDRLDRFVRPGDLVICRLTAPLVEQCIHFITRGISARVEGRDIGQALTRIVHKVAERRGFTYREITKHLVAYREEQTALLRQKQADEDAIQSIEDRIEAVLVCVASFQDARDIDTICQRIEGLFDARRPQITLATVHRTKGLEAERVFILRPDKLPLERPDQQAWQREQELNLKYVALTRAKRSLFFVEKDPIPGDVDGDPAPEPVKDEPAAQEAAHDPTAALLARIDALEARIASLESQLDTLRKEQH